MSWLLAGALALVLTVGIGQAAVWTDKADYSPGEVVTINGDNSDGAGYAAGETVHVDVSGPYDYTASCDGTADNDGAWSCQVTLRDDESADGSYSYRATGQTSHTSETGTFTDAGGGSPVNCLTLGVPGAFTVGDGNFDDFNKAFPGEANGDVTVKAKIAGNVITKICIRSPRSSFALGGSGDDANHRVVGGGGATGPDLEGTSSHGIPITADGDGNTGDAARYGIDYEPDDGYSDCFLVSGMGTATVAVTHAPAVGGEPDCHIRQVHVDVFTEPERPPSANPQITKTAEGSYDRECDWTITKSVDPSKVTQTNGSPAATFNYTVKVSATCNRIEKTQVSGKITVLNPNAGPITISSLSDVLSDSTGCSITPPVPPNAVIPANGSVDFDYTCSLPQYDNTNGTAPPSDLTNKACVGWPDQDVQGDGHLAGPGSACTDDVPVAFTETLTDECVDVSDPNSPNPPLPDHFCVGAAGGDKTYTYSKTYSSPAVGSCADHENTASFVDNSDPVHRGSASKTVRVCNYGSRLTPGYWKTHLAKNGSSGCTGLPSGTGCSSSGPWAMDDKTKKLGNYGPIDTPLKAAKVFAAMNCSSSSSQNAIGCLAGHLLAAKYNRNINTSDPCIDSVITAADAFLISINYVGPTGNYSGITAAQRATAISLKNSLDAYNNGGGCST